MLILLNFAHPLTSAQQDQMERLIGLPIDEIHHHPVQFDPELPFPAQVRELVQQLKLTPEQWQGEGILVAPPTLSVLAVTLLAELHGRMGYFPAVIRLKPTPGPVTRYEVAEIINLDQVRAQARHWR